MAEITNTNIEGLQREKALIAVEKNRLSGELDNAKEAKDKIAIARAEVALEELAERAKAVGGQLEEIDKAVGAAAKK